jgi:lipopolysaccharide transport system ATP-binding protein
MLSSIEGDHFEVNWGFDLNIGVGKYTLSVALHRGPDHTVECLHWKDSAIQFEVLGILGNTFAGICRLEPTFNIEHK